MLFGELLRAVVAFVPRPFGCHLGHREALEAWFESWSRCRAHRAAGYTLWSWQGQLLGAGECLAGAEASGGVTGHGQPIFICSRQGHGVFKCLQLLQLDIGLQGIVETRGEDIDLEWFC
jgi:hypothetical protein